MSQHSRITLCKAYAEMAFSTAAFTPLLEPQLQCTQAQLAVDWPPVGRPDPELSRDLERILGQDGFRLAMTLLLTAVSSGDADVDHEWKSQAERYGSPKRDQRGGSTEGESP
eukprot:NODE_4589_length_769_cov_37.395639_g4566_i0.p2 GENE.NODE_4589_length_769_cov_37.395639_g4566_i0~~NODE_4589_length_769_cov_37.395639_g4566_i0.p2  ORF type:complete len:112 (-),score=9.24 NODE_4589_length_769_cov_37.395639_g4566_i0:228-563(-)